MATTEDRSNSVKVSSTRRPVSYIYRCKESNEVHLSALGVAMSSLVTVAEILKARQLVVVKSLCTMLELFDDRSPKPKLEIILEKSEQFDSVIAEDKHREIDRQLAEQGIPEDERGIAN